jgi:hypothetical protein
MKSRSGGATETGLLAGSFPMKNWRFLILGAAIGAAHVARAQPPSYGYSAAYLSTRNEFADVQRLVVFPAEGEAFAVPLPLVVGYFAFTLDGKTMYGAVFNPRTPSDPGTERLCKIQFNPTRVTPVPGSAPLTQIYSVAVSQRQDKIVVAGGLRGKLGCGIIELSLSDSSLREVIFDTNCKPADVLSHWEYLNLSPDGKRATAYRSHKLEMIDLVRGTVQLLGERFMEAAWSPDGTWLAGLEAKWTGRTILMDPNTLKSRRTIRQSQCQWSPDSRYILQDVGGTLKTIEAATGRRKTILSSKNKVAEVSTAWVSSEIRP